MDAYLKVYYGETNAAAFSDARFHEVNGNISGKIDNDDFNNSGLYKDVSTIGSRNVVNFKVGGTQVKLCDCAAQKTTQKKLEPLFIGKYLIADNNYQGDEPIYIYLPGNNRALPPNNLDNIPNLKDIVPMSYPTEYKLSSLRVRGKENTILLTLKNA